MTETRPEYPNGLNFAPDSDLTKSVCKLVDDCVQKSRTGRGGAPEVWKKLNHLNCAFIDHESESEKRVSRNDPRKPINVVINGAGALQEMFLAYLYDMLFARRKEYYPIQGTGGRANYIRTAMLERVNQAQAVWFGHERSCVNHWRDMHTYGTGAIVPVWTSQTRTVVEDIQVDPFLQMMLNTKGIDSNIGDTFRVNQKQVCKEGTEFQNIDIFDLLIDPDTPVANYQSARYVAFFRNPDAYDLVRREKNPKEHLFNCRYLLEDTQVNNAAGWNTNADTGRGDTYSLPGNGNVYPNTSKSTKVRTCTVFIHLIPKDHGLGESADPEKWMITTANNKYVIQCEPLNLNHPYYPIIIGAPTADAYDVWAVSAMAKSYPLYKLSDWMINMFVESERKSLRGKVIINPSVIDVPEMMKEDNIRHGIILAKKGVQIGEMDMSKAIYQVPVQPVAQQNMALLPMVMGFISAMQGANSIPSPMPDRPTQGGVAYIQQKDTARMQFMARMIITQCWPMLTEMMCSNTIQFMDAEMAYGVMGSRYENDLVYEFGGAEELQIGKWDLNSSFQYLPLDPTMADMNFNAMEGFLSRFMSIPDIAMNLASKYNLGGLMEEVARREGFESVHEWAIQGSPMQVGTVPPDQLQAGLESGRFEPVAGGVPSA